MLVLLFVFQQKNSSSPKSLGRETKYVSEDHLCLWDCNSKLASFGPGRIHQELVGRQQQSFDTPLALWKLTSSDWFLGIIYS